MVTLRLGLLNGERRSDVVAPANTTGTCTAEDSLRCFMWYSNFTQVHASGVHLCLSIYASGTSKYGKGQLENDSLRDLRHAASMNVCDTRLQSAPGGWRCKSAAGARRDAICICATLCRMCNTHLQLILKQDSCTWRMMAMRAGSWWTPRLMMHLRNLRSELRKAQRMLQVSANSTSPAE